MERMSGSDIAGILDHNMDQVEEKGKPLYLVQEWIDGQTLDAFINGHPIPVDHALRITDALAQTLTRCHDAGIYHRDIKPDNIILPYNKDQKPVLVDFGIAWVRPEESEEALLETGKGQELGNRWFRLADNAVGRLHRDPRTDVTMLVGILFHLLSGKSPRVIVDEDGKSPHEVEGIFTPETQSDLCWPRIRRIFSVGFQSAIDSRFQSMDELHQRLAEIISPDTTLPPQSMFDQEYDALTDRVATKAFQEKLKAEEVIHVISQGLMSEWKRLMSLTSGIGFELRPGTHRGPKGYIERKQREEQQANPNIAGRSFWLHFAGRHYPQVEIIHVIQLEGESYGRVAAGYHVQRFNSPADYMMQHQAQVVQVPSYYSGPAADMDGLQERVIGNAKVILGEALRNLREALD